MGKKVTSNTTGVRKRKNPLSSEVSSKSAIDILNIRIQQLEADNQSLREDRQRFSDLEKKLAESEDRYKTLLNTSMNAITIIRNGLIVFSNPACFKALGYYTLEDLYGKSFHNFLYPLEYEYLNKKLKRMEEGRSTETAQLKLVKKDGSGIIMEFTSIPVRYENQPAILFIGQNITPWKESEKALRESEQKLTALFDCAPDCIFMTDLKYRIKFFNRPVPGYSIHDLLNTNLFDLISDEYQNQARNCFSIVERTANTSAFEFELKKSKTVVWISCRVAPLNYGSDPVGYIITLTDISKQKESEIQLKESEKRYVSLFDNINSGVIILQPDEIKHNFILKDINKAALKIIKRNKPEVRSSFITNIFNEYIENGIMDELKLVYNEGTRKFVPATSYHTKQFNGWLEHYIYKISGGEVIVVIEDVTEKHHAVAELKKAKKEWQDIFEAIGQPALILDSHQNIIAANQSVLVLTGKSLEVLKKYKCFEIFHPNLKHSPENCPLNALLNSHGFESQEMEIEALNGTYMVSCTPMFDEQGKINKIIHIATDITDIKVAKNELSSSLVRYQKLVGTIPYGIDELDLDGRIIYTNSAHTKMLGYQTEDLIGKTIFDLQIDDDSRESLKLYFEAIKKDRSEPVPFISKNITSDGSVIDVQVDWNYLEDNEGVLYGFITIISDITDRLEAENDLKLAKEKAEESDRLKSAFLANMSHEVRTPLNGIIGFSTMLSDERTTNKKRIDYVNFIHKAANQLLNIINDLIDISKIESGQLSIGEKIINLDLLMNELFEYYQFELKNQGKKQLEIFLKMPLEQTGLLIVTDDIRLRQVLINLLTNALKFTEKGKIEFGYEVLNDKTLQFYVKDTGIGIAKENQEIVFERFRQEDDSFAREFGGSGLGLAISKGIVEKMGGKIWVNSTKHKGSIFYFTIPYIMTTSKSLSESGQKATYSWPESAILIVEDDPINAELIKATFKNTRAKLLYAKDGEEALKMFNENSDLNLVLLDIRLPYLDGYSVARQMKKLRPEVTIIAHSAYARDKEKLKAEDAGFDVYITKPALPNDILELVNERLNQKKK